MDYALTTGILEAEATIDEADGFAIVALGQEHGGNALYSLSRCCLTKEAALARAEEMRIEKLQSLDEQVKRISAMKIEIVKWGAE